MSRNPSTSMETSDSLLHVKLPLQPASKRRSHISTYTPKRTSIVRGHQKCLCRRRRRNMWQEDFLERSLTGRKHCGVALKCHIESHPHFKSSHRSWTAITIPVWQGPVVVFLDRQSTNRGPGWLKNIAKSSFGLALKSRSVDYLSGPTIFVYFDGVP